MTDGMIDLSNGPYDNPQKYEIIADEFRGKPRGQTVILDENHPMIKAGLKAGALRLMDEPASENDDH